MKTYFLQVKSLTKETQDAVTIEFWHPVSEEIKYKAGQFITICVPIADKKLKRSYSMCSSPNTETALAVTVKRVHLGEVSNYLNDEVKVGDFLEVMEPMGNFYFEPNVNVGRNLVLIAAGSGITPMFSIAKTALKAEPNTKVFMLYGNRNEESIIFDQQLKNYQAEYSERFTLVNILSQASQNWSGKKGRIDENTFKDSVENWNLNFNEDVFYMCGPVNMMQEIKKYLENQKTPEANIHSEKFNAVLAEDDQANENQNLQTQKIKIIYDGNTHDLEVAPHQTILEAALNLNIELPYSCQAGMCTACMGKCVQGKVTMDEEEGLTEDEIKDGYVLTCVGHPASEDVIIEIE